MFKIAFLAPFHDIIKHWILNVLLCLYILRGSFLFFSLFLDLQVCLMNPLFFNFSKPFFASLLHNVLAFIEASTSWYLFENLVRSSAYLWTEIELLLPIHRSTLRGSFLFQVLIEVRELSIEHFDIFKRTEEEILGTLRSLTLLAFNMLSILFSLFIHTYHLL